ncbi:cysteine-rich receptor-like protein kinase 8 [Tanacetum coccineum]
MATKMVTRLGKMKSGLYHLLNVPPNKVDQVFSSLVKAVVYKKFLSAGGSLNSLNKTDNDAYALRHHRLGHCLSCPTAKFAKLPYTQSDSHSTEVFDLIHIDIWGPYKVAIAEKYRSDNALEFIKGECGPYLQSQGIQHQTSYVDRTQQNGRVERKHRHILDTARALRFHSHLPLMFWGDYVTATTYLINRLLSSVLKNKTPYEILLGQVPSYSHLRVFACVAIVSNPSRIPDKFAPKGTPYVFLVLKDPANFKEAVRDPGWCLVMDSELRALEENDTWELTELPPKKKAIGSYWIFKTKLKADGTKEIKNARLVVQWNRQKIEVYMKVPLGYAGKGEKVNFDSQLDKSLVCKLKKSLYGLKQAPRQWFFKLSYALISFGFVQSKTDYSLFVKKDNQKFIAILVYMDDLLITGDLSHLLGLELSKSSQRILISQHKYTIELLKEGGILNHKTYKLPMDPNMKLQAYVGSPFADPKETLYIAANPVFHAKIKHIKVDCHFVRDQMKDGLINPSYVNTKSQLADVFTKVVTVD